MLYYMICNTGTMLNSPLARQYPRQLVLTQQLDNPAFMAAAKRKVEAGHSLILDNGAHEGFVPDEAHYLRQAVALCPDIVVMMDLLDAPWKDSLDASRVCLAKMHDAFSTTDHTPRAMVCPQGCSQREVLEAYAAAYSTFDNDEVIIGLGHAYTYFREPDEVNHEAARVRMVKAIQEYFPEGFDDFDHHVLGARWNSDGAEFYRENAHILSVDTIKPCTSAASRMVYPHKPAPSRIDVCDESFCVEDSTWQASIDRFCRAYALEEE